ncbi:MAG TPA: hypothetical protein VNA15_08400 [Candidatus Angelobacter sp.]|nr:hypothetical protein [Candidatus Angelobacter sp.]
MKRVLPILVPIILILTFVGRASASSSYLYEAGYELLSCTFANNCYAIAEYGTSGVIYVSSSTSLLNGDTIAFWTSVDNYCCGAHWWAQAGLILGIAPNGVTYTQPEMYIEANGTSYTFMPIGPASWNSNHLFQVWINPSNGYANFAIDGGPTITIAMPNNFNSGGVIRDYAEVHQNGSCCDLVFGSWGGLQFYQCGFILNSCWNSWNTCCSYAAAVVSVPPYYAESRSVTNFDVATQTSSGLGGGGGGGKPA